MQLKGKRRKTSDENWKITFLVLPLVVMLSAPASVDAADNAGMEAQYKLPRATVSDDLAVARKTINVLDSRMAYLEVGEGEPMVFVHGNRICRPRVALHPGGSARRHWPRPCRLDASELMARLFPPVWGKMGAVFGELRT